MKIMTRGVATLAALTACTVGLLAGCTSAPASSVAHEPRTSSAEECITVDLTHADRSATVAHRTTSFRILAHGWTTVAYPGVPTEVCGVEPGAFTLGLTESADRASLAGNPVIIHVATGETRVVYRETPTSLASVTANFDADAHVLYLAVFGPEG